MKILFYNHTAQVSGAERLLLMILSRLDRGSFEPVVVCPSPGPLSEMAGDCSAQIESVPTLEARFTWRIDLLSRYLKSFYEVINQLRQKVIGINPDLIHANSIRSGLVATAATVGLRTPVVWHLHDLLPRHPLSTVIRWFALLSGRTRMIAVSQAVAQNFRGTFFPLENRISVILNAIDLDKFYSDPNGGQQKRAELELNQAETLIGIVGQITPRKGQLELLQAFAKVVDDVPATTLLVVGAPLFNGDDEYLELLERTAQDLGIQHRVRMLGARSDVAAIMQALDLLVINSATEPFGLVALEAMACGTTVLATATGGLPEIVEHDKNGWLVPLNDQTSLAEAIVSLVRQPALRLRLAAQAKTSVASRFSAERYLTELQAFYHGCDPRTKVMTTLGEQVEAARFV